MCAVGQQNAARLGVDHEMSRLVQLLTCSDNSGNNSRLQFNARDVVKLLLWLFMVDTFGNDAPVMLLFVRVVEWLMSIPLKQCKSDSKGPDSIPGIGKLDSDFQFDRQHEYQLNKPELKSGPSFHIRMGKRGRQTIYYNMAHEKQNSVTFLTTLHLLLKQIR